MLMGQLIRSLLALALCALLASCVGLPPVQESMDEFVRQQKTSARSLHEGGQLAASRSQWLTVLTLQPADDEAQQAVAKLDSAIAKRVAQCLRSAELAYGRGDSRGGDTWMLKVLAAQPAHPVALAQLQRSQSAISQAQQRDKSVAENRQLLARVQAAPGGVNEQIKAYYRRGAYAEVLSAGGRISGQPGPEIAQLMRQSNIALADGAEKNGELLRALAHVQAAITSQPREQDPLLSRSVTLSGQLSKQFYQEGLALMSGDLSAAIVALEQSVFYNPYNNTAKRKLMQARKLEENLAKIRSAGR